ncbi:LLM class flavin-dependent oxidoreductase [Streptomyces rapamycinicus]|uniref:N5,N10-methylene tetrahydromethanopterin reductase n=2 Tax=Streptomyces rapamycinicus TaxID=1226757 RepID=A0A0A0N3A7_STRRN|nr:LLM class flavin-dependent oxidoreductase [Streptomyces rapamycinicus]AGP51882.1 N5,N10-methylene tetrahydromethanopterin reductase [Streptomyces rapamycinicus NRRL 5491]MBB4779301.1 alkanesulfonate monooxygenase SsuD/methylene tetrahydromethanopterin reductase-like flavin-dependent oxidoreductase (luciferase family) [Streptomyces rapamycinicus]RLV76036.1 N5,N10-methylene tetrahydromethanopterin reductase [Streptomyces rapamycinicus NRRL 5491]UTP28088.1 LLM class flavin-dependent oxidoreduct
MRAGVVVAAQPGVEDLAVRAEELGLHSFWVYDTPMVHGDPFVALSLCAKATRRIRLGIGVTSAGLRSAPAAASGFASLNALAPGRIICGVGTGNTARRTLGMPPTKVAALEDFIAALQDLCAGRSTEYREGDRVRDIRFLHAGAHVNTTDPIEFVVAALHGPKAAAVAGRHGAGLISVGLLDPTAWHALHDARRQAAHSAPRDPDSHTVSRADSYLVTSLHMLHQNEDPDSDAARDATGHLVLSLLDYAADTPAFAEQLGPDEREAVRRLLDRRGTTATAPDRYTKIYPGYLGRIAPQDRDLVLPPLMNALALVGTRDDLLTRITALEQAGVDELLIQPVVDPPAEMAQLAKLLT